MRLTRFFAQWFDTPYPPGGGSKRPSITGPGLDGRGFYGPDGQCGTLTAAQSCRPAQRFSSTSSNLAARPLALTTMCRCRSSTLPTSVRRPIVQERQNGLKLAAIAGGP